MANREVKRGKSGESKKLVFKKKSSCSIALEKEVLNGQVGSPVGVRSLELNPNQLRILTDEDFADDPLKWTRLSVVKAFLIAKPNPN